MSHEIDSRTAVPAASPSTKGFWILMALYWLLCFRFLIKWPTAEIAVSWLGLGIPDYLIFTQYLLAMVAGLAASYCGLRCGSSRWPRILFVWAGTIYLFVTLLNNFEMYVGIAELISRGMIGASATTLGTQRPFVLIETLYYYFIAPLIIVVGSMYLTAARRIEGQTGTDHD